MNVDALIKEWRERAAEYDRRDREATKRKEYIIAAQQAGLRLGLTMCAEELERWPEMLEWRERQANLAQTKCGGMPRLKHRTVVVRKDGQP